MLKIGISKDNSPGSSSDIKDEARVISDLLGSDKLDLFHIRKPQWSKSLVYELIAGIPEGLHSRLKIHDHFSLLKDFNLGGVHLNSRNPVAPAGAASVSKSLHSIEEVLAHCPACFDYVTLSPVYDSISKPGYRSPFPNDISVLRPVIEGKKVVALGGVTEDKFDELEKAGFIGAAMIGALDRLM